VERAYRRGKAIEKRRKLMEAWGRYCETGGLVLSLRDVMVRIPQA
jgi:hypothetical protein